MAFWEQKIREPEVSWEVRDRYIAAKGRELEGKDWCSDDNPLGSHRHYRGDEEAFGSITTDWKNHQEA